MWDVWGELFKIGCFSHFCMGALREGLELSGR